MSWWVIVGGGLKKAGRAIANNPVAALILGLFAAIGHLVLKLRRQERRTAVAQKREAEASVKERERKHKTETDVILADAAAEAAGIRKSTEKAEEHRKEQADAHREAGDIFDKWTRRRAGQ
mgnify:CR=1 FL=1